MASSQQTKGREEDFQCVDSISCRRTNAMVMAIMNAMVTGGEALLFKEKVSSNFAAVQISNKLCFFKLTEDCWSILQVLFRARQYLLI